MKNAERQTYKKGANLLVEKPFAFVLKSKLHSERCDYCFARTDLMKCSGCSFAHYCDRECQKEGWFYHKKECSNMKRISPRIVPDTARMLGRLIIKLQKGGAHERSFYSASKFRVFKDLMSHYNEIKNDKQRLEHFESLEGVLKEFLSEELLPNSAELLTLYGRMVINSFNVLDGEMQSIGTGIYLAASVIDHSCTPNAVAVFEGTTIYIKTLKDLSCLNWSDVFITYIDLLNLPSVRQKDLETMYYFHCQCPRCIDILEAEEMTSMICQIKDCDGYVPGKITSEIPACTKCNQKMSAEVFEKATEVMNFTDLQLGKMKDIAYLDICRLCLNKQDGLLHPMNIYNVRILDLAMESCIALSSWDVALQYGLRVKKYLCKYYGELHPVYGIFLLKLAKIALYLGELKNAKSALLEAANILKTTHGDRHPLVNELRTYLQQCDMEHTSIL